MACPSQRAQTVQASTLTPAQFAVSRDDPVSELNSEDLPTLGLPATQTTRDRAAGDAAVPAILAERRGHRRQPRTMILSVTSRPRAY